MFVFVEDLDKLFTILQIYGPSQDHPQFWNALLEKSFLKDNLLILGGDLNFSMEVVESWVEMAKADSLSHFFMHKMVEVGIIYIVPINLCLTWINKWLGEDHIEVIIHYQSIKKLKMY
jgi:hypothetical protein